MSETTTPPVADAAAEAPKPSDPKPAEVQTFSQEQVNALLAEQKRKERERFAGYDDLKAKASEFDKLTEAQKTEQQRHAEAAEKAKREAQEARAETLRYKAAAKHGVGEDYFDLLGSGDEEAINTRAERVGGLLKYAAENERLTAELEALRAGKPTPPGGRPVANLKPGATPQDIPSDESEYAQYARLMNLPS